MSCRATSLATPLARECFECNVYAEASKRPRTQGICLTCGLLPPLINQASLAVRTDLRGLHCSNSNPVFYGDSGEINFPGAWESAIRGPKNNKGGTLTKGICICATRMTLLFGLLLVSPLREESLSMTWWGATEKEGDP